MNDFADTTQTDAGAGPDRAAADDAIERLEHERDDLRDRLLRLSAEFDNYRKRIERERRDTMERAAAGLIEELLPIVDDFERALKAEADPAADVYREGISIIHRQLMELLARRGVTPLESLGADFDPHVHQAVAYEPSPGHRDGEVIEELRRGYTLGDRLLRPAMVKVARA
jgi:molecular chaperone GrpE